MGVAALLKRTFYSESALEREFITWAQDKFGLEFHFSNSYIMQRGEIHGMNALVGTFLPLGVVGFVSKKIEVFDYFVVNGCKVEELPDNLISFKPKIEEGKSSLLRQKLSAEAANEEKVKPLEVFLSRFKNLGYEPKIFQPLTAEGFVLEPFVEIEHEIVCQYGQTEETYHVFDVKSPDFRKAFEGLRRELRQVERGNYGQFFV